MILEARLLAAFKSQLLFTSRFLGLRSLWITWAEWTYFMPRRIWYKKNLGGKLECHRMTLKGLRTPQICTEIAPKDVKTLSFGADNGHPSAFGMTYHRHSCHFKRSAPQSRCQIRLHQLRDHIELLKPHSKAFETH